MNKSQRKIVGTWLVSGSLLVFAMVIVGGITRLSGSGLSMVDWHPIMGVIPPIGQNAWQDTFARYQESPQFQIVNYQFTLTEFKSIFWWEYIHRLLGRIIGVVFIIPFAFFVAKRWLSKDLVRKCLVMLSLGAFQGLLGWYMVKSGLVNDPYVSHYRLAAHLLTATILFGYILWVALGILFDGPGKINGIGPIRKIAWALFVVVLLQIIYGAFVAGLKAGLVYNTFPKMGEFWVAEGVTALTPFWKNFTEGLAGVQFIHRYLAYVVIVLVFIIWFKVRRLPLERSQRLAAHWLLGFVAIQFFLGVLTLVYAVPLHLAVMHQAFGLLFFGSLVVFNHRIANA